MAVLLERKFKTGASFLSVPISEKVAIPTVEEMPGYDGSVPEDRGAGGVLRAANRLDSC